MLRCFNDCFAALFFWLAIYCYQRNQWHIGSALYSTGLNVKMTLLLPLPAIGIIMVMKLGGREALTQAMIIGQVAVCTSSSTKVQIADRYPDSLWLPLPEEISIVLSCRFQLWPLLPLQVDRQLALCPRVHLPLQAFCTWTARAQPRPPVPVRADAVDQALETQFPCIPQTMCSNH